MTNYQTLIDDYYSTNYTKCPKNTSFLASWQGLALLFHISAVILIPIYIYGGYCIIKITPVAMKPTKWYLFNLHFWVSYTDVMFLNLLTPYFFLPAFAGHPMGLLTVFQVPISAQTYIGMVCTLLMVLSVVALFENRFNNIRNESQKPSTFKRSIFYGVQILIILTHLFPILNISPDQEEAKYLFLDIVPCPTEEYFNSTVYFLVAQADIFLAFMVIVGGVGGMLVIEQILFGFGCVYKLYISNVTLSIRARALQKKFFFGTLLQILIPATFVAFPLCILAFMGFLRYYNQELINCCTLALSIHGLMSTILMIAVHKPYRDHTANIFVRRLARRRLIEPTSSIIPTFSSN